MPNPKTNMRMVAPPKKIPKRIPRKSNAQTAMEFEAMLNSQYGRFLEFSKLHILRRIKKKSTLKFMEKQELREHCETCLNDAAMSCIKSIRKKGLKPGSNMEGYLHTSLMHQVSNYLRKMETAARQTVHVTLSLGTDSDEDEDRLAHNINHDIAEEPEAFNLNTKEFSVRVMKTVMLEVKAHFPSCEAEVFDYSVRRGMTNKGVADTLGVSRGYVKKILSEVWEHVHERVADGLMSEIEEMEERK